MCGGADVQYNKNRMCYRFAAAVTSPNVLVVLSPRLKSRAQLLCEILADCSQSGNNTSGGGARVYVRECISSEGSNVNQVAGIPEVS